MTGVLQAAGSWSVDACCAVHGNDCDRDDDPSYCWDSASSSDWLFGLWPGPPQRFEPTGTDTGYQYVEADRWPAWGWPGNDLVISAYDNGAPGDGKSLCNQGNTYRGAEDEICGGNRNWGATDVEVWYPR